LAIISSPPWIVSSDFGQLVVMRHLTSGIDCAIAGAASVAAPAAPIPVTFKNSLRFMDFLPCCFSLGLRREACDQHGTSDSGLPSRHWGKNRNLSPGRFSAPHVCTVATHPGRTNEKTRLPHGGRAVFFN
jgi:hypothetical protein